ncbi:hypothetical protein Ahy_A01g001611 isoform B [Arachis hypogaea]|uniref:Dolichyl-diphosphooligosaccharide-protein glycosyltransferase subunit OST5 n=1 Tax=Arachis hypogaea TaxID=3818 RepID=A0A445ENU5_ARAHY|nr:hypothetical protein Ahy_A01g001611 isoform B [Arachis hypogaea]
MSDDASVTMFSQNYSKGLVHSYSRMGTKLGSVYYEATTSRKTRSLAQELTTGAVASVFLGFGSLFLLIACGVYV